MIHALLSYVLSSKFESDIELIIIANGLKPYKYFMWNRKATIDFTI